MPKYDSFSSFALAMVKYIQVEVCRPLVQVSMYSLFRISHQAHNVCLLEAHSDFSTVLFCGNIKLFYFKFFYEFLDLCEANIELVSSSKILKKKQF